VTVSPKGFSGSIDMLVGIGTDFTVIDTVILSMSETAGIGTKINEDSFKEKFKNKSANEINSVDTIATATISSRAFINGVNAALAVVSDILTAAAEETGDSGGGG
jgi:electron transport complex protein RnfG